jgi:hypothetical protein
MREELDRKAYDTLERLARHHEQGKIGNEALQIGIRSVWETIAGLASETISETASLMHREVGHKPMAQVRVFRDIITGEFKCALLWTPCTCHVSVLKPSGKVDRFEYETEAEAKARFSLLGDRIASQHEELC